MSWEQKYLKYKQKYMELAHSQVGGTYDKATQQYNINGKIFKINKLYYFKNVKLDGTFLTCILIRPNDSNENNIYFSYIINSKIDDIQLHITHNKNNQSTYDDFIKFSTVYKIIDDEIINILEKQK
jgi:hypothetical protein